VVSVRAEVCRDRKAACNWLTHAACFGVACFACHEPNNSASPPAQQPAVHPYHGHTHALRRRSGGLTSSGASGNSTRQHKACDWRPVSWGRWGRRGRRALVVRARGWRGLSESRDSLWRWALDSGGSLGGRALDSWGSLGGRALDSWGSLGGRAAGLGGRGARRGEDVLVGWLALAAVGLDRHHLREAGSSQASRR